MFSKSLQESGIPLHLPDTANFKELARPYNRHFLYKPAAISVPNTPEDISKAVSCAGSNDVKVQARSGGHSYAAYSLGGQNGSLVIDLRNFQTVVVDEGTGVATVGAGVRLGTLASELFRQGERAVPHGTIPG